VPLHPGLVALPARHARVANFGVRQPCCRSSRAHDPARGTLLTLLVVEMRCVLVTFIESDSNQRDNFQKMFFETGFTGSHDAEYRSSVSPGRTIVLFAYLSPCCSALQSSGVFVIASPLHVVVSGLA